MKSYAEMKPANSLWLGEVPAHWELSSFRYEAVINGGQVDPREEPWSGMTLIAPNHIERNTGRIISLETAEEQGADSGKYLVEQGQLVYSKIRPALNKAAIAETQALCSADMYAMSFTDRVEPRFALYYFLARPFHTFATIISMRVKMPKVNREELADAPWLVPPLDEQRTIADYLDRETARIDTLIEEQQRLIDLLRERREVVIDEELAKRGVRAPTSLDGSARYEVPDGWQVVLLGRALRQLTNGFVGPTRDILVEDGVRYIQSTHIKAGRIDFERRPFYVSREWHDERPRIHLQASDVLIVQTGDIGKVAVVPPGFGDASCHALQIARVRPELLSGEYLATFLSSRLGYNSLLVRATGALHPHLEAGIRAVPVVVPPSPVQAEIVQDSAEQTAKINVLIAETERFIELARERRTALITSAVTGQIDVREIV